VSREPAERVALWMNAADVLLLPSDNEGSPNAVKEAMGCNLPVVATDVGDVRAMISGVEGCHLAERTPEDFAAKIRLVLERGGRTDGRARVERLALPRVTAQLLDVYEDVLGERKSHAPQCVART
jgi:teichuronic acid biosynthesis glycosyltransferase TuaC